MKKYLSLFLWFVPLWVYPQTQGFGLGNFSFFLSPKILQDGSIIDVGLGLQYTQHWGGEIRFRNTIIAKNEELFDVADSLNAVHENIFEVFFLPAEYSFIRTPQTRLWLGVGAYYEYDALNEKGFFNMPELEDIGLERVNSYTNEFSMHVVGPLLDVGFRFAKQFEDQRNTGLLNFDITLSGGVVPVFFPASSQKMGIVPLLDPHYAEYDQKTWGSPYVYLSLDAVLFKFINVVLLYDYTKLRYKSIGFDDNLQWITPESTVRTQSFKIEASLLVPLGGIQVQLGYGYTFDSTRFDDGRSITGNRQYLILTAKKRGE
jgi:hypothetical protein